MARQRNGAISTHDAAITPVLERLACGAALQVYMSFDGESGSAELRRERQPYRVDRTFRTSGLLKEDAALWLLQLPDEEYMPLRNVIAGMLPIIGSNGSAFISEHAPGIGWQRSEKAMPLERALREYRFGELSYVAENARMLFMPDRVVMNAYGTLSIQMALRNAEGLHKVAYLAHVLAPHS